MSMTFDFDRLNYSIYQHFHQGFFMNFKEKMYFSFIYLNMLIKLKQS